MRTISINLKVQIFSLLTGIMFAIAFLFAAGAGQYVAAADLDPRGDLEGVISERLDADLKAIDARFDHRFASDLSSEEHTALPNVKILLADEQDVDRKRAGYDIANR